MIQQENDNNESVIPIDSAAKRQIMGAAKVAGVVALLSISGTIINLVARILKSPVKTGPAKEGFDDAAIQMTSRGPILFVAGSMIFSLLLFYMLFNFSRLTRKALQAGDHRTLSKGLFHLASYFKIIGIAVIFLLAYSFLSALMISLGAAV
ncbi:hypothetical protein [Niabella beijingensis]|uniref:hypothetical protein n=1 Tax=Niabella beijingensis TaxID=2872700 RepID=UPI001CBFB2B2|nr:hypothetical protein [Niabella beijingensis]MBZ4188537.1 hypothetical protein [Niabella beijingensis]